MRLDVNRLAGKRGRVAKWGLVLLLAIGLRLFRLDGHSLWFDEALSVLIGRLALRQVLTGAAGSSHPPGYYLLLHLWQAGGMGTNDWLLRYPSVVASMLSVALAYRVAGLMFDRRTGLLAALGVTLSPFQVYYAQEARMYAMATALTLGAAWCFVRMVRKPRAVVPALGYVLFAVAGLYTHYFVAWVLLAFHVWLLLVVRRHLAVWQALIASDVAVGALFFPQVVQFLGQTSAYLVGGMAWQARPHVLSPLVTLEYLLFGHLVQNDARWWGVRVTTVLLVLALVILEWVRRRDREWRRWAGLLLMVLALPLCVVLAISWLFTSIYLERSFAMAAPFLVLFFAQGMVRLSSRFSPTPWTGLLLAFFLLIGTVGLFTMPDVAKPPVREAMAVVAANFSDGDLCVHIDETYLAALVYEPGLVPALWHIDAWSMRPATYQVLGGRLITPDEALETDGALWLVIADRSSQPWEMFLERVEQERGLGHTWRWDYVTVYRYE